MFLQILKKSILKISAIFLFATVIFSPMKVLAAENIVGVASGNADFSTLVTAIKAAGLVDTLSGPGPFTVFAPTDAAFKKLPAGLLEKLVMPENKAALSKILTYHVVSGKNMAADVILLDGKSVVTVNGGSVKIKIVSGAVVLNTNVNVTKTDIAASNGVIHVIDQVLVPSDLDLTTLVSKPADPAVMKENTVRSGGFVAVSIITVISFLGLGIAFRRSLRSGM